MYQLWCVRFAGATGFNIEVVIPVREEIMNNRNAEDRKDLLVLAARARMNTIGSLVDAIDRALMSNEINVTYFQMAVLEPVVDAPEVQRTGSFTATSASGPVVNSALPGGIS